VSTDTLKTPVARSAREHLAFAGLMVLSVMAFWKVLYALALFSLSNDSSSHIVLIPVVSIYLIFTERSRIFRVVRASPVPGVAVVLAAIALYLFVASRVSVGDPEHFLPGATLAIVLLWMGGFLLCYGSTAWRMASFSLLFLLLMVPPPPEIVDRIVYLLQQGSTEIAYLLFRAVGVPVLRQGFILATPSVTIEVAQECSSIRSSVALVITCLLAAHLFLRTKWKMLVFVLLSIPLSIIKNGIRITTLTLLAVYVDPSFLTGDLHKKGGFVFFLLALAILFPILLLLQKSECAPTPGVEIQPKAAGKIARES
jgi:exosortase